MVMSLKRIKNILLLCILAAVLCCGGMTLSTTKEALTLWFEKLVPSMFVTLVLIRTIYHQQILDHIHIPLLPRAFRVDSSTFSLILCIMFLGFPNGASFIDEAYQSGRIDAQQAKRLLYTCSYAAPGFVIMTCGALLFHSVQIGIQLFVAQICSGWILLLCTRGTPIYQPQTLHHDNIPFMKSVSSAILESGKALYMIGGYLMLFMSVCGVLLQFLPDMYALPVRIVAEFSSGVVLLQRLPFSTMTLEILTCMLLGFGGFCVHMQVCSMSEHVPFSYVSYFFCRILQSILSAIIFTLFLL